MDALYQLSYNGTAVATAVPTAQRAIDSKIMLNEGANKTIS